MQLILDWCTPETPSDNYDADDGSDDDGFRGDEQDLWAPTSKWHEFDCHYFYVRNTGKHTPQYRKPSVAAMEQIEAESRWAALV